MLGLASTIPKIPWTILSYISSGLITYFWLLIFLKPDMKRLNKSIVTSLIVTVIVLLLMLTVEFAGDYQLGILKGGMLGMPEFHFLASLLLFGIPLAYHVPAKPDDATLIFAGTYIGAGLLALVTDIYIYQTVDLLPFIDFGLDIVFLAAIYFLANKDDIL